MFTKHLCGEEPVHGKEGRQCTVYEGQGALLSFFALIASLELFALLAFLYSLRPCGLGALRPLAGGPGMSRSVAPTQHEPRITIKAVRLDMGANIAM